MSVGRNMDRTRDDILEEAVIWFARRRDGAGTCSEEVAFEAWRSRSESHARAYAETECAWNRWKQLQGSERLREMAAVAMAETAPRQKKAATGQHWRPVLAAACLAVILIFGGSKLLPLLMPAPPSSVTYSTALGEQRTEQLPDGTRIVLNTQTALQVRYGRGRREVALQYGEAMFEVAHDASRPFVVTADDGRVTDLGTQFQVRSESGMAIVTLLQGQVEVTERNQRRQLVPGEQARYGDGISGIPVRRVDPSAVSGWLHGRLDFNGMPLADAVAEANRYSAIKLRLGDPGLANMPVGGSFHAGDNATIAAALSAVFPVRVARSDSREIVLMPR